MPDTATPRPPIVVEIIVSAYPSTDTLEIDRDWWDAATPAQRRASIEEAVDTAIADAGGAGWNIADPDDEAATVTDPDTPAAGPLTVDRLIDQLRQQSEAGRGDHLISLHHMGTDINLAAQGVAELSVDPGKVVMIAA